MDQRQLSRAVHAAVFSALIIVGTFIRIPLGPVPIVLANMFVLLAGLFLGPLWGGISVGLYLFLGAAGLPVFSAGGGAALFLGPTGGFLIGYLAAAVTAGLISSLGRDSVPVLLAAAAAGALVIYLIGVPWLMWRLSAVSGNAVSLSKGLAVGALPFLPGDLLKIIAAVAIARSLNRLNPGFRNGE